MEMTTGNILVSDVDELIAELETSFADSRELSATAEPDSGTNSCLSCINCQTD